MCACHCVQLSYRTQHRAVLIIFRLILHSRQAPELRCCLLEMRGLTKQKKDYFFICCKYSCATYSSIRSKPLDALQPRKQQQMIIARQLGRHDVRLGTDAHHWPQTEHVSAIWHILQPTEYICRINQGQANCPSYDKCFPPLQCWLVPLFQGLPLHLLIFLVFRLPVHIFCGPIRICSTL